MFSSIYAAIPLPQLQWVLSGWPRRIIDVATGIGAHMHRLAGKSVRPLAEAPMPTQATFPCPMPCGRNKRDIQQQAEQFAAAHGFLLGDRIEPIVTKLQGRLHYLGSVESIEAEDGSLIVYGPKDFDVYISAFTGTERDRFTIAHELGHYVLHSNEGAKQIRAARFGRDPVEWEANWFAAAFLMPELDFRATCNRFGNDPVNVAARYLVSAKAASVRMQSLGISAAHGGT